MTGVINKQPPLCSLALWVLELGLIFFCTIGQLSYFIKVSKWKVLTEVTCCNTGFLFKSTQKLYLVDGQTWDQRRLREQRRWSTQNTERRFEDYDNFNFSGDYIFRCCCRQMWLLHFKHYLCIFNVTCCFLSHCFWLLFYVLKHHVTTITFCFMF